MECARFKITLCRKNKGIDLCPFMCSSSKYSRRWGGKIWETGELWDNERIHFSPSSHTCCSHVAVIFFFFWEGSSYAGPVFWEAVMSALVCSLPCLLSVCNFSSDHDRGANVQTVQWQSSVCSCCCSLSAPAVGQADYSSGALIR